MSYTPKERRRPTSTVMVPARQLPVVLAALIESRETFTVEPAALTGVWHVGVMDAAIPILTRLFGPVRDVGTLGDYL